MGLIMSKWFIVALTAVVCFAFFCGPIAMGHAEEDRVIVAFVGDFFRSNP